jgi:hypothetical protein
MRRPALILALAAVSAVAAQQSPSFKITDSVLAAGGVPSGGAHPSSHDFRITLATIGDELSSRTAVSASFRSDGGFASGYPPPGEVDGLAFITPSALVWNGERSGSVFDVYRGTLAKLGAGDAGSCIAGGLPSASASDPAVPLAGRGFSYLVAVRNRLGEEGTKGRRSDGRERPNSAPCP